MNKELEIYLGVDWGAKRIGLALADSETKIATPFKTVSGVHDLTETAREENADVLVIGQPVKMRGIKDGLAPEYLEFVEELKNKLPDKEIILVDERLSSKAADALPGGNLKAARDEVAAMLLLQEYLDGI
ncbi:MAG TPA: Holliday junction resolvase RuvX [Candidatus Nanoarchaeia archaeon]|nr:Holliday junction resolvase RuvX [Candidatus Nanoarchaeia archaeon]